MQGGAGRVTALETVPGALECLEAWFVREWRDWYGPRGIGDASRDLNACLQARNHLPRCLVSLDGSGDVIGTVSLRDTSPGSDRYPGVWVTALLVPVPLRRSGLGTGLIAAAEAEALRLGFSEIHASTASAQSLFRRRDWCLHDSLKTRGAVLDIFRKSLKADASSTGRPGL
ncbi:GNAT family N-acetyltransferase [Roseibium sp. SCP14]|uniref:GNAT family N-acetyltransferase n=1 Tax=Roseibium sp. SCP14 TaxID=3141375 RepID=UPI00333DC086